MNDNEIRIVPDYKGNEVMEWNGQAFAIVTDEYLAKSVITNYDDSETTDSLYRQINDLEDDLSDVEEKKEALENDLNAISNAIYYFTQRKSKLESDYVELIDKIKKIVG